MEQGYIKGDSDNLPVVDANMVHEFYSANTDILTSEVRNVKLARAARESYGDNAVGYVQLKRSGSLCTVKAKLTPEHRVRASQYSVMVEVDEREHRVISCKCNDCTAAAGVCKHGVAFLFWLHRRSEEPSATSTTCYWKTSSLSRIGRSVKNMDLAALVDKEIPPLGEKGNQFLASIINSFPQAEGGVFDIYKEVKNADISLYQISLSYLGERTADMRSPRDFIEYASNKMTQSSCDAAEVATRKQAMCPEWFELRYGRITASKIYEASRCKTLSGTLHETIFGAVPPLETASVLRGKKLEKQVLAVVETMRAIKIQPAGLFLRPDYPLFGATPDGLTRDFVIEVKCPSKEKAITYYVEKGVIKPKYMAQINIQMLFSKRKKGLFCVASPSFELTKQVSIYEVNIDEEFCEDLIVSASTFWSTSVYPFLVK